jgi:cell division ATPase FtsA
MIKDGGVLIVDIGARTTILTIYDEGSIRLSTIVPIAGNYFTKAISESLDISLDKAEEFKKTYGFYPKKKQGKVMFILQRAVQEVLNEIKKSIRFYEEKKGRKIKKILLCGGSSFMPKLSSYIASNFSIETLISDPWKGINVEKLLKRKKLRKIIETKLHPVFFANVIGMAKRALEKDPETAGINLIPEEERLPKPTFIGRKLSKSKIFSFLTIGFTIIAFIFLGWVIYTYIYKALFIIKVPPNEVPIIEKQAEPEQEVVPKEEILPEKTPMVIIKETETGWLRVREKPGTIYLEIAKVYSGETYPQLEKTTGWYKIELKDGRQGWISTKYASEQ